MASVAAPIVDPTGVTGKAIGLVVGIATADATVVRGFGATTKGGTVAPTHDSVYELCSVTKLYTAFMLSKSVAAGKLALTDTIDTLYAPSVMPSYAAPSNGGAGPVAQITVLDLAMHYSGLPNYPVGPTGTPGNMRGVSTFTPPLNPGACYTTQMMLDFLAAYALLTPPCGTEPACRPAAKSVYSNLGSGMLGDLLTRKTPPTGNPQITYDTLVERLMRTPLGLTETMVDITAAMRARKVTPYVDGNDPVAAPEIAIGEPLAGSGALQATADDVLKFLQTALTSKGTDPTWAEVIKPRQAVGAKMMGLQVAEVTLPSGRVMYTKDGSNGGHTTFVAFALAPVPVAVVLLSNHAGTDGLEAAATALIEAALDGATLEDLSTSAATGSPTPTPTSTPTPTPTPTPKTTNDGSGSAVSSTGAASSAVVAAIVCVWAVATSVFGF
jgi:CubicO group peptidase (beta-lactamase class C family)